MVFSGTPVAPAFNERERDVMKTDTAAAAD
jgi:hypothetical protein